MTRSNNEFQKNRDSYALLPKSSNTFTNNLTTGTVLPISSNSFSGNKLGQILPIGNQHGWEGENLTSDIFGSDKIYEGEGEITGSRHFEAIKNRT